MRTRAASRAGMTRRKFLACSLSMAALARESLRGAEGGAPARLRAAIIGHTGHGDYGHDHDLIFNGRDNIEVVAVADPDAAGRARAVARSQAQRGYEDYRVMLEKEKPKLVCVAPRCTNEHYGMAMAALRDGAHVYLEKPFTRTLAEADELLALGRKSGLKIAVAHQMRLAPNIVELKKRFPGELGGDLLQIQARGKQDRRAGGEDLVVLGIHLFDLMRLFAGDPLWCSARVLQNGHEITLQDARAATENIGPVAGDDIVAEFGFASGARATFTSQTASQGKAAPYGMDLMSARRAIKIQAEMAPRIFLRSSGAGSAGDDKSEWRLWEQDPTLNWTATERSAARANGRVVDDWLSAIAQDREPVCSGLTAMKALEMAMAVFAAGLDRRRVELPLKDRRHPLEA